MQNGSDKKRFKEQARLGGFASRVKCEMTWPIYPPGESEFNK